MTTQLHHQPYDWHGPPEPIGKEGEESERTRTTVASEVSQESSNIDQMLPPLANPCYRNYEDVDMVCVWDNANGFQQAQEKNERREAQRQFLRLRQRQCMAAQRRKLLQERKERQKKRAATVTQVTNPDSVKAIATQASNSGSVKAEEDLPTTRTTQGKQNNETVETQSCLLEAKKNQSNLLLVVEDSRSGPFGFGTTTITTTPSPEKRSHRSTTTPSNDKVPTTTTTTTTDKQKSPFMSSNHCRGKPPPRQHSQRRRRQLLLGTYLERQNAGTRKMNTRGVGDDHHTEETQPNSSLDLSHDTIPSIISIPQRNVSQKSIASQITLEEGAFFRGVKTISSKCSITTASRRQENKKAAQTNKRKNSRAAKKGQAIVDWVEALYQRCGDDELEEKKALIGGGGRHGCEDSSNKANDSQWHGDSLSSSSVYLSSSSSDDSSSNNECLDPPHPAAATTTTTITTTPTPQRVDPSVSIERRLPIRLFSRKQCRIGKSAEA